MIETETSQQVACGLARIPSRYARIAMFAFCSWVLIVLVLGARMAYRSAYEGYSTLQSTKVNSPNGVSLASSVPDSQLTYAFAALAIYLIVFLVIIGVQAFRPRLTLLVALLSPVAIFTVAVFLSGSATAALAACAVLATSWMVGDLTFRPLENLCVNVPLCALLSMRIATGLGLTGAAILALGAFDSISFIPILAIILLVTATWAMLTQKSSRSLLGSIQNPLEALPRLDWFESLLIGLSAAFFAFAALASLTPETIFTASDSVRQHLPQAREIWQDHAALVYPTIETPSASVLGATVNALAFGFGGITAVRVLQVLVSLCCLLAIAGLGATLAGRLAGISGAAFFSALPLALWLTGHAYPDLLAVLFLCASVQCVICWQNDGQRIWLIIAGMLAGFSLATKQISAVVFLALIIALAISAGPGIKLIERVQALALIVVSGLLTFTPWLVRSAILTGSFPLLRTALRQLANIPGFGNVINWLPSMDIPIEPIDASAGAFAGGVARSLPGIITGPWDLTFKGAYANFQVVHFGEFGILLLMLLPFVLVNFCSRPAKLIGLTTLLSFVGWVFTIQVPRHLLPTLALLAVLIGVSVATIIGNRLTSESVRFAKFVQIAAVAGLAMTPLYFLPNIATSFPITVLSGVARPVDYLARVDPATAALMAATALLPADTRVGYIGQWQGAQSSTETRLIYFGQYSSDDNISLDTQVGNSPEAILERFRKWGLDYFIWDRPDTRLQDVDSTLLSGDFLLRYTTIIGGDNNVYLFAVHPEGVTDPTSQDNMIEDPSFVSLRKEGNVWHGSRRDLNDAGNLQPRRQVEVSQRVAIDARTPYLLVLTGSCGSSRDQTRLTLDWLDANLSSFGVTADYLSLGTEPNSALMLRTSPESAMAVDVRIATAAGKPCAITHIGMYEYDKS